MPLFIFPFITAFMSIFMWTIQIINANLCRGSLVIIKTVPFASIRSLCSSLAHSSLKFGTITIPPYNFHVLPDESHPLHCQQISFNILRLVVVPSIRFITTFRSDLKQLSFSIHKNIHVLVPPPFFKFCVLSLCVTSNL